MTWAHAWCSTAGATCHCSNRPADIPTMYTCAPSNIIKPCLPTTPLNSPRPPHNKQFLECHICTLFCGMQAQGNGPPTWAEGCPTFLKQPGPLAVGSLLCWCLEAVHVLFWWCAFYKLYTGGAALLATKHTAMGHQLGPRHCLAFMRLPPTLAVGSWLGQSCSNFILLRRARFINR